MTLAIFLNMVISSMTIFARNSKSYVGWIRENPGIHGSYHFCNFPSKIKNLGLKFKIFKFLGIQPKYGRKICCSLSCEKFFSKYDSVFSTSTAEDDLSSDFTSATYPAETSGDGNWLDRCEIEFHWATRTVDKSSMCRLRFLSSLSRRFFSDFS